MGEAARDRIATRFRCDDTIDQTIALYRDLLPEHELRARRFADCEGPASDSRQSGFSA
jgi:hypothetical protein